MIHHAAAHDASNSGAVPCGASPQRSQRRWMWGLAGLAVAAGLAWLGVAWLSAQRRSLPAGITENEYARAAQSWKLRYRRKPGELDVLSWLAESAVAAGNLESAAACFERIPTSHPVYGRSARHQQGQVLQKLNRLCSAERNLREFIELETNSPQPQNEQSQSELLVDAMQRLRSLLELELRFEERRALLQQMFQKQDGDLLDTLRFLFPSLQRWNGPTATQRAEAALAADPDCFEVRRAIGRYRTGQGRLDESREILDACLRERPGDLATYSYVLACEFERGGVKAIVEPVNRLSPPSDRDPWLLLELRGYVCNDQQRFAEGIDCFERVLREDPANSACHQGIATACQGLHLPERYEREMDVMAILARIQVRVARLLTYEHPPEPILEIAEMCEQLGLQEHARRMARQGLQLHSRFAAFQVLLDRIHATDEAHAPSR
jgi:tetratricopeptide (TPR) repeat protein